MAYTRARQPGSASPSSKVGTRTTTNIDTQLSEVNMKDHNEDGDGNKPKEHSICCSSSDLEMIPTPGYDAMDPVNILLLTSDMVAELDGSPRPSERADARTQGHADLASSRRRVDSVVHPTSELLRSLVFPGIRSRQETVAVADTRTFRWVFESHTGTGNISGINHWLSRGSHFYWLSGKAGSGKSTLMSLCVLNLGEQPGDGECSGGLVG